MGTCGEDYTTTALLGQLLNGVALGAGTIPTITQGCSAIVAAQTVIDSYLQKTASYTSGSVPLTVRGIALRVAAVAVQVQKWWGQTQGAVQNVDEMGSATFSADLLHQLLTSEIKKELDDWKIAEEYVTSGDPTFAVQNVEDGDLNFGSSNYS